jgi:diguanylate cyclase (GGDEF)-like protein/PAS domain S-box-containing protein
MQTGHQNVRCLHSAQVPVIAGFGIMILLLIGVAAIGVSHIRILSSQLTAIVAERNLKTELAASMKSLHESRYQAILTASNLDDPFERDEQNMRFSEMAREFIRLRDRFLALPLDAAEMAGWGEVRKELPRVEAIDNEVIDLIQANQRDQAKQLIQRELKQGQLHMMAQWDHLVEIQRAKNNEAVAEATAASAQARGLVLILSGMALLVAVGVAVLVIRVSRRMESELFQERERAVVTLSSLADAVVRFDQEHHINYMNTAAENLLGLTDEKAAALPAGEVLRLYQREDRSDLTAPLFDEVFKGMTFVLPPSAFLMSVQGMEYEVEGKCSSIHGKDGEIIGGVLVLSDVSEARELQRKLLWHSDHDVLTGLANRYSFEERLAQALSGKRASESRSSMLLISLHQLKQVREQAGHACSDEIVSQLSRLIDLRVRDTDFLARLGEDEFGILLLSCPDEKTRRIADQIRDSVLGYQQPWQGKTYQVGVHVGVVHLADCSQSECLTAAYSALHEAESRGSGSVVVLGGGESETAVTVADAR